MFVKTIGKRSKTRYDRLMRRLTTLSLTWITIEMSELTRRDENE
jgi:hypothetical protein